MYTSEKSVLIMGSSIYAKAVKGLFSKVTNSVNEFFRSPHSFGMIMFTGGEDVSPDLYNDESPLNYCKCAIERDRKEVGVWTHAFKHKVKMTGICRGAQFINVMSGGTLLHHLYGHEMKNHNFVSSRHGFDKPIEVNSLHHQMIIPPKEGFIIGWSPENLSTDAYVGYHDKEVNWPGPEVEAVLIPHTKCCGVQYHPEMMDEDSAGYKFYRNMVRDMLTMEAVEFAMVYTGSKGNSINVNI